MIGWFIFLFGALAVIVGLLIYYYRRDQRYLHQRTREALSDTVRKEIAEEVEAAKQRQEKFKKALKSASKLAESQDNSLTKL
jgi:hypothetical protein